MNIIAYNIKSLPEGWVIEDVIEMYYASKVLVYEGSAPYIIDKDNLDHDIVIIDNSKYNVGSEMDGSTQRDIIRY